MPQALRYSFVEGDVDLEIKPLQDDFNFAHYLATVMGQLLAEVIMRNFDNTF